MFGFLINIKKAPFVSDAFFCNWWSQGLLSKKLTKCQVFICKILEDVIEPSNMLIAAAKLRTQELSSPKQTSRAPFDWLSYKYKKSTVYAGCFLL